jgi:hypothetical protein
MGRAKIPTDSKSACTDETMRTFPFTRIPSFSRILHPRTIIESLYRLTYPMLQGSDATLVAFLPLFQSNKVKAMPVKVRLNVINKTFMVKVLVVIEHFYYFPDDLFAVCHTPIVPTSLVHATPTQRRGSDLR